MDKNNVYHLVRNAIEHMPAGRGMDYLVATWIMGQTDFTHLHPQYVEGVTEDGQDGWNGFICPRCGASEGDTRQCMKYYSTDLRAVWEVVEHLQQPGEDWEYYFSLERTTSSKINPNWIARVGGTEDITGETIPLAICRAALLAVIDSVTFIE